MMKNPKAYHLGDELKKEEDMLLHRQVCDKVVWFPSYPIVGHQEPEQKHI